MNENTLVVYMDASLYRREMHKKQESYVGLGIYIIDKDNNDIKIGKGFFHKNIKNTNVAEITSLNLFVNYVKKHEYFNNKNFIIYSDCEAVVKIINGQDVNIAKLGIKKDFITSIKDLNIEAAYWIKGHQKEKGNLIVDTLAYNSMRMTLDNKDELFETITTNKHLVEIFDDVKRCPSHKMLLEKNKDLNIQSYNRIYDIEKNYNSKADSQYYKEKLTLIEKNNCYIAEIKGSYGSFTINGKDYSHFNFDQIGSLILTNYSMLREMKLPSEIKIYIEDPVLLDSINKAKIDIEEVKNIKVDILANRNKDYLDFIEKNKSYTEKEQEVINKSDIHSGIFKMSNNKNITIDSYEPQRTLRMKR